MSYSNTATYEAGVTGDPVTGTNTSSDTVRISTGAGTGALSSAQHHSGSLSVLFTGTSTNGLVCVEDTLPGLSTFHRDFWVYFPTLPSGEMDLTRLLDSTAATTQGRLTCNNLGTVQIRDSTGTSLSAATSGHRITAAAWFELIYDAAFGATGTQRFQLLDASGTSVFDSTTKTSNGGSSLFGLHRRGFKAGTATVTGSVHFDDDVMTGNSPATANAGPDQTIEPFGTILIDCTGSSGSGSLTYTMTQDVGDALSIPLTQISTGVFSATAPAKPAGATAHYALTVNDGVTTSSPDNVVITVLPHTMFRLDSAGPTPIRLVRL